MDSMKVISGGQTGADRAGLDAARSLGLATGGEAPSRYWTENGPDPSLQALGLNAGGSLAGRTAVNVMAANATVIFACRPSPGSDLTIRLCRQFGRPFIVINPFEAGAAETLRAFLDAHRPAILNVAGHRESKAPGIYRAVYALLVATLSQYLERENRAGPASTEKRLTVCRGI